MKASNRMRPVMEDYVQQDNQNSQTRSVQNSNNQRSPSHYGNIENNMRQPPLKNVPTKKDVSRTNQVNQVVEQTTDNYEDEPQTNQSHSNIKNLFFLETKEKDYKINPRVIPRPNHFDEIYRNSEKLPIYDTSEDIHPPHSSTFYIVNETQNSSCRFIRSSLTKVPTDQSILNNSSLLFGVYAQPFAELLDNERAVPKIEITDNIFRCRRCQAYINSKFEVTYNKANKPIAICNLCACENELDTNKPGVKSEYFNSNVSSVAELAFPTVDFHAPGNMKHTHPFIPHYIFLLDISQLSNDIGLSSYILNSLMTNLDYIHNAANSFVSIATFDNKSVHFFALDKNSEVKAFIVPDIDNPFCPLPRNKLFINVDKKTELEKVVEKISAFIIERNKDNTDNKNKIPGSVTGAAIAAGVDALGENGGRVIVFTCNVCLSGFGACKPKDDLKLFNTVNEKTLYLPQHQHLNKLAETCILKRVVVDQFIIANSQFDLATFSTISNLTGGCVNFYNTNLKDLVDMKLKFEKIHYDLSRILTRPNYYDCKFMLRMSLGIETIEILGPFNKKLGEAFQLAGCDPDYSFCYNLRLTESIKNNQRIHFQLVCLYIDNFNERFLRIFNYTVIATNDVTKIYSSADVDVLSKITLMKEISLCYQADVLAARENLNNKIVNSFLFYRLQCSKHTPPAQLILPASIKHFPLFLNSFIKKPILRRNKLNVSSNSIVHLMNKFMHDPVYINIKYLYPKFFRIDDIQNDQSTKFKEVDPEYVLRDVGVLNEKFNIVTKPYLIPLSLDHIDFNCAYISDDGEFLTLFIFNLIDPRFYQELFNVNSFEEALELNVDSLDESNTNDLNVRLLNIVNQLRKDNKGFTQPLRIIFLDDKSYNKTELSSILVEDKTKDETHYVDYLCSLHEEIQKKMTNLKLQCAIFDKIFQTCENMYGIKGALRKHRCFEAKNYFLQCKSINSFFALDKKYFPQVYATSQYQWNTPHHDYIHAEPSREQLD